MIVRHGTRVTRRAVCGVGTALAGAAAAACAGGGSGTDGPANAGGTAVPAQVSFLADANLQTSGLLEIFEEYKRTRPQLQVEAIAGNDEKLHAMSAAGTPPDVARINDNYARDFGREKLTQPMDAFVKKSTSKRQDFYELIYDFGIFDGELGGKRYAWAMGAWGRMFFVNLNLFRQAGVAPPPNNT